MSLFFISQLLAGAALCTDITSFQLKNRLHIIFCLILSCFLLGFHFVCLNYWTAAALSFFSAFRYIVSFFSTNKHYAGFCIIGIILLTLFTWNGPLSLLAAAGSATGTIAAFCKEDKNLRQIMLLGTSFWLTHNILAGSPAAVMVEIVFFSSNCFGYFRFYILPKRRILSNDIYKSKQSTQKF